MPVIHVGPGVSGGGVPGQSGGGIGQAQPVSMASGDVDQDGFEDLLVGYSTGAGGFIALHRGNVDAFAPQSDASFQAIGRGEFPAPFHLEAQTFSVGVSPDFIALGNFTGSGSRDLAVAARGGNVVYIFAGDGKGNFDAPQTLSLPGGVTSLAAGEFGSGHQSTLIVGASRGTSFALYVFGASPQGLTPVSAFPLNASPSNILFGEFGDPAPDAAFLVDGQIRILRSSTMQLATVSLPVSVRAFALGSFLWDRNGGSQIALVGPDGSVQIAVRNEFDPRAYTVEEFNGIRQAKLNNLPLPSFYPLQSFPSNGWRIVESFPGAAALGNGQAPVVFRTRVSINGADDVMVLNAFSGQLALISHPDLQPGALTFLPGQVSLRPYSGTPIAAVPMRVNVDGRPGVVALHQNEIAPSLINPIPDPTFFVNKDTDPTPTSPIANACNNTSFTDLSSSCSLREAVLKANGDTIMLQAGHTYSLTIGKVTNNFSGNFGALYVNNTATIVGGNQNTTIIQWGTPGSGTVDMVMAVNEDISPITNATASISNLTIQGGVNHGTHGNDGDGGCMEFDTGSSGNANLTFTNVTLQGCSTTFGNGAGIAIFNFTSPNNGLATFTASTVQNNSAVDATANVGAGGGGIWVSQGARASLTNTNVLNNKATQVNGTGKGIGGGIFTFSNTSGSRQTVIHSSTISGNKSAGFGGGIWNSVNLLVDQGTVISGNTAGTDGTNPIAGQVGGGLYDNTSFNGCPGACTDTATLTKVTITGNTASQAGGGIYHGNNTGGGSLTMSFSRLAGNTVSASNSCAASPASGGTNLAEDHSVATVTNNWWGTNAAASTINNCSGTATFDPFIVLTHTSSPNNPHAIRINQSATFTGDMSKDNHGNGAALSGNLDKIVGLPITFNSPSLGTIPQPQPETLGNPVPTATATFNAGGTAGLAKPTATVDQATVEVNSNLIASATESGTTATITTVGAHGFSTSDFVTITGVGVPGYNGQFFPITSTPSATTFTYAASTSGLAASNGGTASVDLPILQPPSITKTFGGTKTVKTNTANTITFSITNGNVIPIDANFTDILPTNVGTVPGNLVVATTPNVNNGCGGSVTANAGSGTISFSNASLPAGSCTIKVDVQSATDNLYNNSVTINSTVAGNGNTSSDTLTVINPPSINKVFGAATIPLNGTSSLTFTVTNPNSNLALGNISFSDTLPTASPAGSLVVATPNGAGGTCLTVAGSVTTAGSLTAVSGSSSVSLSGLAMNAGGSCTVAVNVKGTLAGQANNSVTASDATAGAGNTSSTSLIVVGPPNISKSFSPKSVPLNSNSTLSFTVTNPNTASALSGVAFTDSLPAGVKLASTTVTGSCGSGTITATINNPPGSPSTVSLSGGTLTASPAAGSSCTFSMSVTGISLGAQVNTTGTVSSTEGGTGGTASDTLTVAAPPTISKSFSPKTVALNSNSTLSFTLTNPNTASALSGVAFTDSLPGGVKLASTTVTGTCGSGTITATINNPPGTPSTVSLSGGTLTASPAAGSSCTFSVSVTGIAAGAQVNTTGTVTSTEGGTGGTASDTLTVAAPATISKSFSPKTIPLNGSGTLSFTLTNPSTTNALSGVAFTDSLPAGVKLTSTTVTGSCGSGTITATINNPPGTPSTVSLSGGTLTASPDPASSCTFSVSVTGIAAGAQVNTTGNISSTEGGTGGTASDTLTVIAPPTISKKFGHTTVPLNQSDTLSFTLTNPNTTSALSGIAFTDSLPGGLKLASTTVTGSCGSGTITATINNPPGSPSTVSLSGGTLTASPAAGSSCTFSVSITGISAGAQVNTTSTVSSTEGGTGGTATDTITVVAPPTTTKVFNPITISVGGTSTMTITITNPSTTVGLTGVGFTDTFPANLVVANPNGLSNTCNGTTSATAGAGTVSLTGGTIAANSSCAFTVTVTSSVSGTYLNSTGPISSTEGGNGAAASATLTVASPPTISKSFSPKNIPFNGGSTLSFTITNPNNNVSLSGISVTDSLPGGVKLASTTVTGSCGSGTITATINNPPGTPSTVSLSGGTLAASGSCTFSVSVTGIAAGAQVNTTGNVSSTEGGTGGTASDTLIVAAPPTLQKQFGAASVALGQSTTLSFTVHNPNSTMALSGIGFVDNLPGGLQLSSTTVTGSCGSGTITAVIGPPSSVTLSGGTLAASGTCTFSVNVTGTAAGTQNNTTGAITSTEGGTGGTASASIAVVAPPLIAKGFNPGGIQPNGVSTLTVTITNPAANTVAEQGVAFTDNFPANLVVATPNNLINNCGGTATATSGSGALALTGGSVGVNTSCTVSVSVTATPTGSYLNSTGPVSSTNGGTNSNAGSATLFVALPPTITKLFLPNTVTNNQSTLLSFTIQNPNSNSTAPNNDVTLTGISFTDNLPTGLVVASNPNVNNDCGGTVTAIPGSSTITLTGGTIAPAVGLISTRDHRTYRAVKGLLQPVANGACFPSVEVTANVSSFPGNNPVTLNNQTNAITANESGPGAQSNVASLTVTPTPPVVAPTLTKAFNPSDIAVGQTTALSYTVNNPNATTQLVNVNFTDSLPSGLVIASPNGLGGTCLGLGAGITATPGTGTIVFSVNLAAAASCSFSVNVTATTAGTKNNVTSNITAQFDDGTGNFQTVTGGTASATLTVEQPVLSITKTHVGDFPRGSTGDNYTITVSVGGVGHSVGTITVTDTLPNVNNTFVPTAMSGTGWTCTLATLTCTRSDSLNSSNSYPPITLTVNVPQNIRANVTNSATVSGGGDPNSHTANDPTHIGPPNISIDALGGSLQIHPTATGSMDFDVESRAGEGTLSMGFNGPVPPGVTISFNPASTNQLSTTVTMVVTAVARSSALPPGNRGTPPLYAALFPLLGIAGLALARSRGKAVRLRLAFVLAGLMILFAFAGCGGTPSLPPPFTGSFPINVTATSPTTGDSASTSVTITVF